MANLALLLAAGVAAQAPNAASSPTTAPLPWQSLVACRSIAEGTARLACYDREVAAFEAARGRHDVAVIDREQIRQSRRSVFGLSLPRIALFGIGGEQGDEAEPYRGTIRSVRETRDGKWMIGVDEAVWQTTEVEAFSGPPRVGSSVTIRRASLGGFILTAEGRRGLRAVRLR